MRKVFISYSHADSDLADLLAGNLRAHGVDAWFDDWEIGVGDSIIRKIQDGISKADFLIAVMSPASVASKWVREELEAGMAIAIEKGGFVLPILLQDCELPLFLRHVKYADFRGDRDEAFGRLLDAIEPDREDICEWISRADMVLYDLLSRILRDLLGEGGPKAPGVSGETRRDIEEKFASMKNVLGMDDIVFPHYVSMCIEERRVLALGGFLRAAPEFLESHPEACEEVVQWMTRRMVELSNDK